MKFFRKAYVFSAMLLVAVPALAQEAKTYAERLGFPPGAKVVLFHTDDVGMSHGSNLGAIEALENGLAKSWSVMMPCPWVPEIAEYLKKNPDVDSGLHLTLTSEWSNYRWGPLVGKPAAPGLVDPQGCLWPNGGDVVQNATPGEVEAEIRAQIERAEALGMPITHIDSHMGTLFASEAFFERYMKVGIEKQIPILMAGGHLTYINIENAEAAEKIRPAVQKVWDAGLPVLDDIHTGSYDWKEPAKKKEEIIRFLRMMKPGITEVILHCSIPTEEWPHFTTSASTRLADTQVLTDPEVKKVVEEEGIIITTWKELKQRRDAVGK